MELSILFGLGIVFFSGVTTGAILRIFVERRRALNYSQAARAVAVEGTAMTTLQTHAALVARHALLLGTTDDLPEHVTDEWFAIVERRIAAAIAEVLAQLPAGEPVGEPTCQHGTVDWCQQCDDEAREAVRLDVRGEPTPSEAPIFVTGMSIVPDSFVPTPQPSAPQDGRAERPKETP